MDERISLESVKRTDFSAPGEKPEEFAELCAECALSGSHRTHKRRVTREFFGDLRILGKQSGLLGGEGGI
jgi:hypothetical protein